MVLQLLGNPLQQKIAHVPAERIVHIAQMHDIECDDRGRSFGLDTVAQGLIEALAEQRPLRKARQCIVVGEVLCRGLLLTVLQGE